MSQNNPKKQVFSGCQGFFKWYKFSEVLNEVFLIFIKAPKGRIANKKFLTYYYLYGMCFLLPKWQLNVSESWAFRI
jgi:hypothetical protein